jgi:DUF1680 family protein
VERGYASIARAWQAGDTVDLTLPMEVRSVAANDAVEADRGRIALQRGPVVFAAESVDNGDRVREFRLPADDRPSASWRPDLLGGVTVLEGSALLDGEPKAFTAVPYYTWANRGLSQMAVWFRAD